MARYFDGGQSGAGGGTPVGGVGFGGTRSSVGQTPIPPAASADPTTGALQGGVAGGAAAGPYGAIIGAMAGLLGGIMQQKDAEKARKLAFEAEQKQSAQDRLFGMQNRQIQTAGQMGDREQSAIQQLMGVFARSAR